MHFLASLLVAHDLADQTRQRADADVRAMYARPDALPLPPKPAPVGWRGRIAAAVRRDVADPAPG